MENLASLIEATASKNIETVIKEQVDKTIIQEIERRTKDILPEVVSKQLELYIIDFIKTAKITEGGGLYSDKPTKEYIVEDFIKKEIAERLQSNTLKVKNNDRYGDKFKEVPFEDFIKSEFNVSHLIKKELESFMKKTKDEINSKINDTFTDVTKNMLSEAVYNVLLKNDTFKKLSNNIKCIADKKE
jgi:hypothetical protein